MEKEEELEKKKKIKISQGKRLYNQGALTQPYNGNLIFILQMWNWCSQRLSNLPQSHPANKSAKPGFEPR